MATGKRNPRGASSPDRIGFIVVGLLAAVLLTGAGPGILSQGSAQTSNRPPKLAPFVPTPMVVVERMLEIAEVKREDVVYDLGSGDGRIVITAAKRYGARAVGFEIDPRLVQTAREEARRAGVDHLVTFRQQDLLTADLSPATVVTLYLFPEANRLLRPRLQQQLKPGARVVSNDFDMEEWMPDKKEIVDDPADGVTYTLYLWRIGERRNASP